MGKEQPSGLLSDMKQMERSDWPETSLACAHRRTHFKNGAEGCGQELSGLWKFVVYLKLSERFASLPRGILMHVLGHPAPIVQTGQDKTHGKTIRQALYRSKTKTSNRDIGQMHNDCQMDLSPKEQTVGRSTLASVCIHKSRPCVRWDSASHVAVVPKLGLQSGSKLVRCISVELQQ
ncbi:hypothetical protein ABBQ32_009735 [Trebouxia sp. C0010 RCD-2024]